jgi:integrase
MLVEEQHVNAGYAGGAVECVVHVDGEVKPISAGDFCSRLGMAAYLRHGNTYKKFFKPALIKAGLDPALRFHDLGHSATSIAGSRRIGGQSAKVVQALLGHSSQQITTDIYTHIFP